jgi:hypothetical protein
VTGALLTLIALIAVVVLAVRTADPPDSRDVPGDGVQWGTLNSGAIEDAARFTLGLRGEDDPDLTELARYHAFDMAARGIEGEVTPEGEDHAARRARLTPLYLGVTRQVQAAHARTPGDREVQVGQQGARLLSDAGFSPQPGEAFGVGAAVEQGLCALVVVLGRRAGRLSRPPTLGVDAGYWSLDGQVEPGVRLEALRAQLRTAGRSWTDATNLSPPEDSRPGRFQLILDLPPGRERLDVRVLHGDSEILSLAVREP